LGLSVRQIRRLLAAYRQEGAAGLEHGNRGRVSPRRVAEAVAAEILRLAQTEYLDYNDQHFTEELDELHKIEVSRSTCAGCGVGQGWGVRASGERLATVDVGSATLRLGCYYRWMVVRMTGWKDEAALDAGGWH